MNKIIDLTQINYKPEYSLDLQGWGSTHPIFEELISKKKPNTIIEVGTWKGASAINMANLCKKYNLNSKIYCVDTWLHGSSEGRILFRPCVETLPEAQIFWNSFSSTNILEKEFFKKNGYPQIYYQFLTNVFITNNQAIIAAIPNTSYAGYQILKQSKIKADLIYIDGSHEYEDVYSDLELYYKLLNDNGIIFGDDFNESWSGVRQGVINFCKNKNINFIINDEKWMIKKINHKDCSSDACKI